MKAQPLQRLSLLLIRRLSQGTEIMKKGTTTAGGTPPCLPTELLAGCRLPATRSTLGESIATMSDCAQALLGLIERVHRTRDATTADRICIHCSFLESAAWRLNRELRSGRLS